MQLLLCFGNLSWENLKESMTYYLPDRPVRPATDYASVAGKSVSHLHTKEMRSRGDFLN